MPLLNDGHRRTPWLGAFGEPPLEMLFRPEEQHRRSGESDVVPPVARRNEVVDDVVAYEGITLSHLDVE